MAAETDALIASYLLARPAVAAITDRVVGISPPDTAEPWVRITLLDDPSTDGGVTDHHVSAYVQFDCFAGADGDQETAADLRNAVRSALAEIHQGSHSGAVFTGPPRSLTSAWLPDTSFEPAMPRYTLTGTFFVRGT